jgi:hypothetical protein
VHSPGASRRGNADVYVKPSSPAKAGDPVFRGVGDETEKPRRTGYPACAGYDGRRVGKANGSRECAPDDELRVPTTIANRWARRKRAFAHRTILKLAVLKLN